MRILAKREGPQVQTAPRQIDRLSGAIGEPIRPFAPAAELLCTAVGIQRRGAECILATLPWAGNSP